MELVDCYKKNPSVSFNFREKEVWENLGAEKQKLLNVKSNQKPASSYRVAIVFQLSSKPQEPRRFFFSLFFFSEYVEEMS